jgi:hypothetical protein
MFRARLYQATKLSWKADKFLESSTKNEMLDAKGFCHIMAFISTQVKKWHKETL